MDQNFEQYFEQNATDGVLSDDAMAKLLIGDMGDTATAEAVATPDTAPVEDQPEQQPADETAGDGKPDNRAADEAPVVLAKDGKNIIPYEKLVEAREEAKSAREAQQALMQEMKSIKAQVAEMNASRQQPQQEVKAATSVDVTELERQWYDALEEGDSEKALGIRKQINDELKRQAIEAAKADYAQAIEENRKAEAEQTAMSLLQQVANDVIKSYPSLDQNSPNADTEKIAEVVEYRDFLISSKGLTPHDALAKAASRVMGEPAKPTGGDTPVPAKTSPKVNVRTPTTMSDIPAGTAPHHDEVEALMQMSNTAMLGKFMSMDANKIMETLGRMI